MKVFFRLLSFLLLISASGFAQPSVNAVLVTKPPVIDGHMNDEVWINAAKGADKLKDKSRKTCSIWS